MTMRGYPRMEKSSSRHKKKKKKKRLRNLCIEQSPNSILLMILLVDCLRLHSLSGGYNLLVGAPSRATFKMRDVMRLFGQTAAHDDAMNATLEVILGLIVPALTLVEQATVVVGEGVRHLVVDGVVTDLARGIGHAQWHAQHVLDEDHDQRRPHDVPADDEQRAHDLQPHLLSVAVDGTSRV